jgi:GNAT superfamily N-acetyltransferase
MALEQHYVDLETGEEVFTTHAGDNSVTTINCLLYRDSEGVLIGILNHYDGKNPLERADAVNLWVRPDMQRKGIGRELVSEAQRLWPAINPESQRYTADGVKFLGALLGSLESRA